MATSEARVNRHELQAQIADVLNEGKPYSGNYSAETPSVRKVWELVEQHYAAKCADHERDAARAALYTESKRVVGIIRAIVPPSDLSETMRNTLNWIELGEP